MIEGSRALRNIHFSLSTNQKYRHLVHDEINSSPTKQVPVYFCYVHMFTNGSVDHGVLSFYMIYLNVY